MSRDITISDGQQIETAQAQKIRWQRVAFASVTLGDPPHATFHAVGATPSGVTRHFSQAVRVTDEEVLLRLIRLPAGADVRICVTTDWNTPGLPVTLLDFCCVENSEAAVPEHQSLAA